MTVFGRFDIDIAYEIALVDNSNEVHNATSSLIIEKVHIDLHLCTYTHARTNRKRETLEEGCWKQIKCP